MPAPASISLAILSNVLHRISKINLKSGVYQFYLCRMWEMCLLSLFRWFVWLLFLNAVIWQFTSIGISLNNHRCIDFSISTANQSLYNIISWESFSKKSIENHNWYREKCVKWVRFYMGGLAWMVWLWILHQFGRFGGVSNGVPTPVTWRIPHICNRHHRRCLWRKIRPCGEFSEIRQKTFSI